MWEKSFKPNKKKVGTAFHYLGGDGDEGENFHYTAASDLPWDLFMCSYLLWQLFTMEEIYFTLLSGKVITILNSGMWFFLFKFKKNKGIFPKFSFLKKSISQYCQTWDSSFLFHLGMDSCGCRDDTFDLVRSNKVVKYDTSRLGVCAECCYLHICSLFSFAILWSLRGTAEL